MNSTPAPPPYGGTLGPSGRTVLHDLRHSWWIFLACIVLPGAIAYGLSSHQANVYQSSAALYFQQQAFDAEIFGNTYVAPSSSTAQQSATNSILVSLPVVAETAAANLGGGYTAAEVSGAVSVANDSGSNIETITAKSGLPERAAAMANAYARAYVQVSRAADRAALDQALVSVNRQLNAARSSGTAGSRSSISQLQVLADRISVLRNLQTGDARVAQKAKVPTAASSPKPKRDAVFGILLGLILAVVITVIRGRRDRVLRAPSEVSGVAGGTLLGTVPEAKGLSRSDAYTAVPELDEALRLLRARLRYFNVDRVVRSIAIASAGANEGKSTITFHLARSHSGTGMRVLVVEADLRRPRLAQRLGMLPQRGLSEFLSEFQLSLPEITLRHDSAPGVDIVLAGGTPPNPAELLESERMQVFLQEAEALYDIVLFDTAPMGLVADAIPLMTAVDGVLVVARIDGVTHHALAQVLDDLRRLGAPVLGVVANGVKRRHGEYYGSSYYDNGGPPKHPEPTGSLAG